MNHNPLNVGLRKLGKETFIRASEAVQAAENAAKNLVSYKNAFQADVGKLPVNVQTEFRKSGDVSLLDDQAKANKKKMEEIERNLPTLQKEARYWVGGLGKATAEKIPGAKNYL